jgi:hypothetical protein
VAAADTLSPRPPRDKLYHGNQLRWYWRLRYYEVMMEDDAFMEALRQLVAVIQPRLAVQIAVTHWLGDMDNGLDPDSILWFGEQPYEVQSWILDCSDPKQLEQHEEVRTFAETWRLPRTEGLRDLCRSVFSACAGHPIQMVPRMAMWDPSPAYSIEPTATTFTYNPADHFDSWVRERIMEAKAEVEASILRQVREAQQKAEQAGFQRIAERDRDDTELKWRLRRLYRATRGWSAPEIARVEFAERKSAGQLKGWNYLRQTPLKITQKWAERLDVPLPPRRPGPQPRRQKH